MHRMPCRGPEPRRPRPRPRPPPRPADGRPGPRPKPRPEAPGSRNRRPRSRRSERWRPAPPRGEAAPRARPAGQNRPSSVPRPVPMRQKILYGPESFRARNEPSPRGAGPKGLGAAAGSSVRIRHPGCIRGARCAMLPAPVRGGAGWQLVGLITRRSEVQILPPLPNTAGTRSRVPAFSFPPPAPPRIQPFAASRLRRS